MLIEKQSILLISILSFFLVLSACGKQQNEGKQDTEKLKDVTVTDAMGEVTIPADTKRIVAPYMEDALLSLGITPAAQWSIGETVLDYLQKDLKDVPKIGWDLPLEQTIEADPDLIIFSSAGAVQNGKYEEYKKIAPTYVFKDEDSSDWKKQLKVMGTLFGKEKEANEKIADYEKKVKAASSDIKAAIGEETAAIIWVAGDQYYLFENNRFAANVLYQELGVAQPEMIKELPKAEATWQPVSLESLSKLDADHLFIVSKPGDAGLEKLKKSSIYNGLPVKAGNVYDMQDPTHWTINGMIANSLTIDEITKALTEK
ncbi:ABC transporter substrate-binding protein [Peribacillus sp. SCS-155]|uniref:ABC transporter substrate-binding protein n=1 Tax=Peribacillus sedimenti TaxID=3115297 RepID=UPI003906A81C